MLRKDLESKEDDKKGNVDIPPDTCGTIFTGQSYWHSIGLFLLAFFLFDAANQTLSSLSVEQQLIYDNFYLYYFICYVSLGRHYRSPCIFGLCVCSSVGKNWYPVELPWDRANRFSVLDIILLLPEVKGKTVNNNFICFCYYFNCRPERPSWREI